jgi:hypothetical protein
VKQHLGRQVGVQDVEVSLRDGKVDITPKEDGRVDPAQLLKATYDSGVSVAEMDMIVRGKVVRDQSGNLNLESLPNQSFVLASNPQSESLASLVGTSTQVTVRGQLFKKSTDKKKAEKSAPLKLLILEIEKKE